MQLLGLIWAQIPSSSHDRRIKALLQEQRQDGGWSQLPSLESDSYATGQALVALHEAGISAGNPAYQKGVAFLLKTQLADGSWLVKTRSQAFQPYFESGYPHAHDQWISAAGASWATTALAIAARTKRLATRD